jgi:uncharacterized membrane protein
MEIKDPIERRKVLVLNTTLLIVFGVFIAGSYWFRGVDFAKGTLLGCVVVAINFFVSQRLVGQLMLEQKLKPGILVIYVLKFGISGLILFLAITKWQVDIIGIMFGLSSIVVASVSSAFVRKQVETADE